MITFVYRSPYAGPLSKHVRRLPDASILDWFRRGWDEAREEPDAWLERELGVYVYGLDTIFEEAAKRNLAKPASWQQLHGLLERYLYVEGEVRVAEGSVRVLTDDDEVVLAYHLLDDAIVETRPDRLAYHVHPDWPLPATAGQKGAAPLTTVVLATFDYNDWPAEYAVVEFDGVRLPEFPAALRTQPVDPDWPAGLVALRALLDDDDLPAAIARLNRWATFDDETFDTTGLYGPRSQASGAARAALRDGGDGPFGPRRPQLSRIETAEHLVQAALHLSDAFGYRQLFIFDDHWTTRHPQLAAALLHYATDWDPLG